MNKGETKYKDAVSSWIKVFIVVQGLSLDRFIGVKLLSCYTH